MLVYLSSPGSQMHADQARDMPVLLSYGCYERKRWIEAYAPSFSRLLIDSGAFSEFNTGKAISREAYTDWARRWPWADAVAALDDIRGDWERGIANWQAQPGSFPTYHNSDPPEALSVILSYAPRWLGLGMVPPRDKTAWLDETLARIPAGIHVHGWALQAYANRPRLDSVDSTNWFREAQSLLAHPLTRHLTPAECVEVIVKRYQRGDRQRRPSSAQGELAL